MNAQTYLNVGRRPKKAANVNNDIDPTIITMFHKRLIAAIVEALEVVFVQTATCGLRGQFVGV